jgi:hypothetical protein
MIKSRKGEKITSEKCGKLNGCRATGAAEDQYVPLGWRKAIPLLPD